MHRVIERLYDQWLCNIFYCFDKMYAKILTALVEKGILVGPLSPPNPTANPVPPVPPTLPSPPAPSTLPTLTVTSFQ